MNKQTRLYLLLTCAMIYTSPAAAAGNGEGGALLGDAAEQVVEQAAVVINNFFTGMSNTKVGCYLAGGTLAVVFITSAVKKILEKNSPTAQELGNIPALLQAFKNKPLGEMTPEELMIALHSLNPESENPTTDGLGTLTTLYNKINTLRSEYPKDSDLKQLSDIARAALVLCKNDSSIQEERNHERTQVSQAKQAELDKKLREAEIGYLETKKATQEAKAEAYAKMVQNKQNFNAFLTAAQEALVMASETVSKTQSNANDTLTDLGDKVQNALSLLPKTLDEITKLQLKLVIDHLSTLASLVENVSNSFGDLHNNIAGIQAQLIANESNHEERHSESENNNQKRNEVLKKALEEHFANNEARDAARHKELMELLVAQHTATKEELNALKKELAEIKTIQKGHTDQLKAILTHCNDFTKKHAEELTAVRSLITSTGTAVTTAIASARTDTIDAATNQGTLLAKKIAELRKKLTPEQKSGVDWQRNPIEAQGAKTAYPQA